MIFALGKSRPALQVFFAGVTRQKESKRSDLKCRLRLAAVSIV